MKHMFVLILTLAFQMSYAQHHNDHSHHHAHTTIKDQNFKKFAPTQDLKVRMEKILSVMKELKDKKDDSLAIKASGEKVSDVVKDIFKTCKLDPKADAAIHPALGKILQGSRDLQKGNYDSGHAKIHESLKEYGTLFSHDGWSL